MAYAVIDTNIFVSALITHNSNAATVKILNYLSSKRILPLYNDEIITEYEEVLHRKKFKLPEEQISAFIDFVKRNGIDSERLPYDGDMPDEDDRVFYETPSIAYQTSTPLPVAGRRRYGDSSPMVSSCRR